MRLIAFLLLAAASLVAQRPRYGGTLVMETAASVPSVDPSAMPGWIADLVLTKHPAGGPFQVAEHQPDRRLVLSANEEHPAGRPYLDRIEILLGRSHADQLRDFESGRAHVVELLPSEVRRQQQRGRRVWTSRPMQLIALAWDSTRAASAGANVREALALAIDRQPMLNVIMQRQGEIAGGLLPQWLTAYAFLFPTARDLSRARQLVAGGSPVLALYCDPADAPLRTVADRIALNARDAGIPLRVVSAMPSDVSLVRLTLPSMDAAASLEAFARVLGLPGSLESTAPEAVLAAERRMLSGRAIVPLFHVPALLGIAPQVRETSTASGLRWPVEDAWLEAQ